jgi:hypothetical protein
VFKENEGKVFIASLEAKSQKTMGDLKVIFKDAKLIITLITSAITLTIVFLLVLQAAVWWVKVPISLIFSGVISLLLIGLADDRSKFHTHGIIEQVKRYPADEKWIALSMDSYKKCLRKDRETVENRSISEGNSHQKSKVQGSIYQKAKSFGIGMLVVSSNENVQLILEPKHQSTRNKTNYLKYYRNNKKIENELDQ